MTHQTKQIRPTSNWLMLIGLITLLGISSSQAGDWFMKIDGGETEGQATDDKHNDWILILSLDTGLMVTNSADAATSFSCEFKKEFDRHSPKLMENCLNGKVFPRVSLAYVLDEPRATKYRITLKDVLVTSVKSTGNRSTDGSVPADSFSINFAQIEVESFDLDPRGGTTGGYSAAFELASGIGEEKYRPAFKSIVRPSPDRKGLNVSWPVQSGHRYQVLTCSRLGAPWQRHSVTTATEDGVLTESIPTGGSSLFVRVEEID